MFGVQYSLYIMHVQYPYCNGVDIMGVGTLRSQYSNGFAIVGDTHYSKYPLGVCTLISHYYSNFQKMSYSNNLK